MYRWLILSLIGYFIEAIWYLFWKYKGFRKAVLASLVTMGIQETEKS